MAFIQIPNLTAAISLAGDELFEGVQAGASVKISLYQIMAATRGGLPTTIPMLVSQGGTGAVTLTGYVKGSGTTPLTASTTIPNTDITGLGTMSTQDADAVAITGGSVTGITDITVPDGGTGASTLTGYVKGSGTSPLTASATIPSTDITGLGTMSTQNANAVAITGGSITGITDLAVADGGTGASTLTGYVKGTGTSPLTASATIPSTDITGLGTMSTQNANAVAITGGTINGTTVGATSQSTGAFTSATVAGNFTVDTNTLFVDSVNNRVGVGTASPNSLVEINVPSGTSDLRFSVGGTAVAFLAASTSSVTLNSNTAIPTIFLTSSVERLRIAATGAFGLGGTNFGTTGQTIISAGSASTPAWGVLPTVGGGTGQSAALTQYGVIYGSTTTAMATTAAGTATQVLHGNAAGAPTFSAVSLTADVSGTLPVGNGGTGVTTSTGSGSVVLGTGPTITAAALNGTVGATTPSTGAFTTLSASSTVSGTGFSTYLASPPAIGSTAASTGAFTTVTASTSVLSSGTGGVGYSTGAGVAPAQQLTNRTTSFATTGNSKSGALTLFTTTAVVGTYFSFTVPNTGIAVTDTVVLSVRGATNTYVAFVSAITAATSFQVTMASVVGTASDTPIVNFTIIKGVSA